MSRPATAAVTAIDSKKPATKQEIIAANIELLIEQLEAGKSDALTDYLTAMSRFHTYSFGNVLEIVRQMPSATRVAGFWTWKNMGRRVKAGAKGIRILAPIVRKQKDADAPKDIMNMRAWCAASVVSMSSTSRRPMALRFLLFSKSAATPATTSTASRVS